MESGNSKEQENKGNEPPHKNSIHDKEFGRIFGFTGDNTNYMSWKRLASILEIKETPSSTQGLKEAIDRTIAGMEWIDVEECYKLYTIKHSAKKPKTQKNTPKIKEGKEEEFDYESDMKSQKERMDTLESLLMKLLDQKGKEIDKKVTDNAPKDPPAQKESQQQ
jgi:hypothetical protein